MSTFRWTKKRKLDVLRLARDYIARPRGWVKGHFSDHSYAYAKGYPAYCAIGALRAAAYDLGAPKSYEVHHAISFADHVQEHHGKSVADFNDAKKTTRADVLAAFDAKIAELQA